MTAATPGPGSARRLRRRSKRLGLALPVHVSGVNKFGETFHESTSTLSVSAHGGLVALVARVQKGQSVLVANRTTREEQEVRVVYVGPAHGGKWKVGVEFVNAELNFWRVHFPATTEKPLKTAEFKKVAV